MCCVTASSTRRHHPAGVLQACARPHAGADRALRGEPADGRPGSCATRPNSTKALDLALFVNGIPVATAELKNPLTGQGVEQAIAQYRTDRDPKNRTLSRAVVHFAVDPQRVAMTTRLAGAEHRVPAVQPGRSRQGRATRPTRTGMPRRTCGSGSGSGTPGWTCSAGSSTSRSRPRARGSRVAVIFPRYHQWDAVLALEAAARRRRRGPLLPGAALRRVGQVEHHRLAGAPALHAARGRHQGVRQGHRDHRPGGAGPAAAGHHLPVRARPRRGREDRHRLGPAGRCT